MNLGTQENIDKLLDEYRNLKLETIFAFDSICEKYQEYAKFVTSNIFYTGFPSIDNQMKGIRPGEVVYIISPTNVGKSSIAMNILQHNLDGDTIIPFFSLENNEYQIFERIVQLEKGCSSYSIETAFKDNDIKFIEDCKLIARKWDRIVNIVKRVELTDIVPYIKVCEDLTQCKTKAVVIDYVQLIKFNERQEYLKVSEIAQVLKEISLNLRLPIIVLSQVSRFEARKDEGLDLYSAKGSGEIENSAQILFSLEKIKAVEPGKFSDDILKMNDEGKLSFLKLKTLKKKRGKDLKEIMLTLEYPSLRMREYNAPPPIIEQQDMPF